MIVLEGEYSEEEVEKTETFADYLGKGKDRGEMGYRAENEHSDAGKCLESV